MKKSLIQITTTLVLVFLATASQAENNFMLRVVQVAEHSVRQAVQSKFGSSSRVAFEQPSERALSTRDRMVTGTAHVHSGTGWDFERTFQYSVKVRVDNWQTSDLVLEFTDGKKVSGPSAWQENRLPENYVHLMQPRWYERFESDQVTFEGEAGGTVTITVYDSRNRKVGESSAKPVNGRFRATLALPEGQMRAVVESPGAPHLAEARFSVNGSSQDWGHPEVFDLEHPGRDALMNDPRVTFSGNSSEPFVRVLVWDSRNNRVADRQVPTKAHYWNTQVVLEEGSYHFTVESGRHRETRRFQVATISKGKEAVKPSGGLMVTVRVTEPKRDGTAKGPRVTIAGNSSERSVQVQLWDSRNNRVIQRDVPTRNDYWNTQVPLLPGRYRLKASGASGRDYEEFWFEVK
ncbi:MAG TPA: hypothetical protein P5186_23365 [Candidatus Paceibacterota bacterium]|nr:hypothetical protein [Verrucomicrobiota bacterium]HRY50998.1 hypothetical protein [Candidatus Paceibacterota bacterium]HSA01114.1 hypothetical protein [Candidatus Paceibacterota bacterium]